jgi:DNA-binding SARP family transcriptional activator
MTAELASALAEPEPAALHLLDGPYAVIDGRRRELPEGSKRLVVYVALNGGRVDRRTAAGALWPDGGDVRAAGNLRSALWRMRGAGVDLIDGDKTALWLRASTAVDLRHVADWAGRLIEGVATAGDLDPGLWCPAACALLPGWYDEWVVFERERLRQRVLHGMEALGRLLVRDRRPQDAVVAARCVVAVDPLRESAQRVLVEAQLAAGDPAGARSSYAAYRSAVLRLLGAPPSAALTALVRAAPGRPDGAGPVRRVALAVPGVLAQACTDRGGPGGRGLRPPPGAPRP